MRARGLPLAALAALAPVASPAQTVHSSRSPPAADEKIALPEGYSQVWADEFDRAPACPIRRSGRAIPAATRRSWYNDEKQHTPPTGPRMRVENWPADLSPHARNGFPTRPIRRAGICLEQARHARAGRLEIRLYRSPRRARLRARRVAGDLDARLGRQRRLAGDGRDRHHGACRLDPGRVHGNAHTKAYNHVAKTQKART